ncbi:hypothetical protein LTR70_006630 [Exophiala xenobiotica]|uniref:Heterokaryon incompatibility domain-containing protein n=1 Tax=Lithohypha guttulata TaxID=1690604 RepID=A0ABR0KNR2_9EURO|nr:hypothetical protein LTR24_000371 [Lithohypha guttulata]KAK5315639.1 hypothetical protein LTR70_006630 [Exophiala xenobiotica]
MYRQKLMLHAVPTVFIWVDAICLDFSNIRERNSQVQIMPNIYQRAKTVLAWLQPLPDVAEDSTPRADLERFVNFLREVKKDLNRPQNFVTDRYLLTKYIAGSASSPCRFSNEWRTLLQLCCHHYWSRLWILQENRFAQNLMYLQGDTLWSWSDFRAPFVLIWYLVEWQLHDLTWSEDIDPARILHTPAADVIQTRTIFERPEKFSSLRSSVEGGFRYFDVAIERWHLLSVKEPLPDLLKAHRRRLCSERLDKVYALVGLSSSSLTVDYDRSNIELFCAVVLSLKVPIELNFISMLAHHLEVSAFQYQQYRRSIIKDVLSTTADPSAAGIIGSFCQTVYSVKSIPARTEISDILQARLGLQNLNYYCVTAQQSIDKMSTWNDFPQWSGEMPRVRGHTPGTQMPIIDDFDLSDTSFRPAMFLNPSSRTSRKPIFGMVSTDSISNNDILVTEDTMHTGIIIRISGLRKAWLTVIGVALFARRVTIESEPPGDLSGPPGSPTSTVRSTTLSDFCEHTCPTPFTITGYDDRKHFTLKPCDIHLASLLEWYAHQFEFEGNEYDDGDNDYPGFAFQEG